MRKIEDKKTLEDWIRRSKVLQCFDTPDLVFQGYRYEKGEFLTAPDIPFEKLLFLVKGTIQIYGIRDDGSISPVSQAESPTLIGDVEFQSGLSPFFAKASTSVDCLALSVPEYREQLDRDLRFLHTLMSSYVEKLRAISTVAAMAPTVEQRLLLYLDQAGPDGELKGIESATLQLQCSRRQLQRVLKKLCQEGKLLRTGKGRYRLAKPE
ncbi:MAG: Crp/Fnr family transcriptional regulator [Acutalibacter sp.]